MTHDGMPTGFRDDGVTPFPDNPPDHPIARPFIYFRLDAKDDGNSSAEDRYKKDEYINRQPVSVQWDLAGREVILQVSNAGLIASDFIRVDYEIRYCTYSAHGPLDGFTVEHAGEDKGSSSQDAVSIDFVLAGQNHPIRIQLNELDYCENLYIRARVSGFSGQTLPSSAWNFLTDPTVVESWTPV